MGSTVNAKSISTNALAGVLGDCCTTFINEFAWAIVILENAVIRLVNALAGVAGELCTTEIRLFAWSCVSGAAKLTLGTRSTPSTNVRVFIYLYYHSRLYLQIRSVINTIKSSFFIRVS
jgi:hypothetical protein